MTEPSAGSDVSGIKMKAEKKGMILIMLKKAIAYITVIGYTSIIVRNEKKS